MFAPLFGAATIFGAAFMISTSQKSPASDAAQVFVNEAKRIKLETGELKWEFLLKSPPWAGLMATAGGLVFGGSNEGNFYALDASTGEPLWSSRPGARSPPIPSAF